MNEKNMQISSWSTKSFKTMAGLRKKFPKDGTAALNIRKRLVLQSMNVY